MKLFRTKTERSGFTLIELLVVIAIIAILAAILFPVFARAKKMAIKTGCGSNLQQIAKAMIQYAQDHNGRMPRDVWLLPDGSTNLTATASDPNTPPWRDVCGPYRDLQGYVKSQEVWICPGGDKACDYGTLGGVRTRYEIDYRVNHLTWKTQLGVPSTTKGLDECTRPEKFYMISDRHSNHHYEGKAEDQQSWIMIMVMADGHLASNVRPYDSKWKDTKGALKYSHWDFPQCHSMDSMVVAEY